MLLLPSTLVHVYMYMYIYKYFHYMLSIQHMYMYMYMYMYMNKLYIVIGVLLETRREKPTNGASIHIVHLWYCR